MGCRSPGQEQQQQPQLHSSKKHSLNLNVMLKLKCICCLSRIVGHFCASKSYLTFGQYNTTAGLFQTRGKQWTVALTWHCPLQTCSLTEVENCNRASPFQFCALPHSCYCITFFFSLYLHENSFPNHFYIVIKNVSVCCQWPFLH